MSPKAVRFCQNCGDKVVADARFCGGCGAAMPAPDSSPGFTNFTRVRELFDQALALDAARREAWLEDACRGDAALLSEVRGMIQSVSQVSQPAVARATQFVGPYRIAREIGRGGMGVVYLAMRDDGAFRKNVALKLLLREQVNPEFVARFKQERQVVAALDHPNIARILDGGDAPDGMPYYVMEYVEGLQVDKYCDEQRLSLVGRIRLFQQVCQAVHYLHQNSIVHRDLKPSNILVSSDGVVKLLDFGIAKLVGAASFSNQDLTNVESRPMTPTYASPEQIAGATTLQKTSDIYSLGVILYKLLTGRAPYAGIEDKIEKLAKREDPPAPSANIREDLRATETTSQLRRAMLGSLDSIVLMAMRYDPKERYQSAADFANDLQHFLDGQSVLAHHDNVAAWSVKMLRRKRMAIGVLAAFLAVCGFGGFQWRRAEVQKTQAATREAQLRTVLDSLESRLDSGARPQGAGNAPPTITGQPLEERIQDVRNLKKVLDTDFAAAVARRPGRSSERDALLDRSVQYLDRLRASAPPDPQLGTVVATTYQQVAFFQENPQNPGAGNREAIRTYRKAAAVLTAIYAAHPDDTVARDRLQALNRRIEALGGVAAEPEESDTQPAEAQKSPASAIAASAKIPALPQRAAVQPLRAAATESVAQQIPDKTPESKPATTISPQLEDRFVAVTSKVQVAAQAIEPYRQSLARDGQVLNPDIASALNLMQANLDKAKREMDMGNETAAAQSLANAEALAGKVLRAAGR